MVHGVRPAVDRRPSPGIHGKKMEKGAAGGIPVAGLFEFINDKKFSPGFTPYPLKGNALRPSGLG
jgi:hypothetical protein